MHLQYLHEVEATPASWSQVGSAACLPIPAPVFHFLDILHLVAEHAVCAEDDASPDGSGRSQTKWQSSRSSQMDLPLVGG